MVEFDVGAGFSVDDELAGRKKDVMRRSSDEVDDFGVIL
jgi:hypothetical protein